MCIAHIYMFGAVILNVQNVQSSDEDFIGDLHLQVAPHLGLV